jgi:uncharacterized membrane protein
MKLGAYLLWTPVAVATGWIVLLGYLLNDAGNPLADVRLLLLRWAVWIAAAAVLMGLLNLLAVHWSKISLLEPGWPYSALVLLFFLTTLVLGIVFGTDYPIVSMLFQYVQLPVEASLMGLLAITLVLAGVRLMLRRKQLTSAIFLAVAVLVLLGTGPWPGGGGSALQEAIVVGRRWITQVFAAGGARGIVIGIALGAITTGLRVLLASDRPYAD